MKKITLLFTFLIAFGYSTYAQVSAYAFSQSVGTYTPISGGTIVATATGASGAASLDDLNYSAIPIPFTFNFDGTGFNDLTINTNGHVVFGTAGATGNYTPISGTGTYSGAISAAGRDLNSLFNISGYTGEIRYETLGSGSSRTFVIQFSNFRPWSTSTLTTPIWRWNFQIRLNETTNVIDIVYDYNFVGAPTASTTTNEVGLRGANNTFATNVNNRLITSGTHTWATSAAGTTNASKCAYSTTLLPASGRTFTWTPPNPCTGTPVAGTVAPVSQILLTGQTPATLVASGYSSGVTGLTFQWQESDDDGAGDAWANAVGGTGATTASYTPPAFSGTPIYYRLLVTCTNSALFANTTSVLLTSCSTVTAFTENFDGVTTPGFPSCWAKVGTTGSVSTQTANPNSAPNTLYMYATSGTTRPVLAMQPVSNLGAGTHRLRFNMRANSVINGVVEFGYLTNPSDATTFVSLGTATAASLTYTEYIITPAAGSYTNYPAFRHTGVPANSLLIDDVKWELVPACLAPNTLSTSNITATSANLSWIDGSGGSIFDYEYVVQAQGIGMPAGAGTPLDISSFPLPVTAGSLTASTPYEFWVRANCGGSGFSTWAGPINFTTACATLNTFPFTETFEVASTSRSCWSNSFVTGTSNWTYATGSSGGTITTAFAGTLNARFVSVSGTASPVTKLVSPTFNLTSLTAPRLIFQYGQEDWAGDQNELKVYYRISSSDPWVEIGYYTTSVAAWTQVILALPAPSANYQIAFEGINNWGRANVLDNVTIEESPACANPIGLAISGLTDTAATISWTATTGSYQYVLDMIATDPAGPGTALASETYNASSLTPSTTYYFHVRTVCSGPTYSTWSTISFTTPATPPANDNCSAAQVLTPGGVFADNAVIGTTIGANTVTGLTYGCQTNRANDVWYSVVVPASGTISIETQADGASALTDTVLSVFSGVCGSLVEVGCDDDGGTGTFSLLNLTQPAGSTLYIGVWRWGSATNGTFTVSAYDASLSSNSFDSNAFLAYPNPVKDVLNLEYNSEISSIKVMNLLGQEVISRNINANSTQVDMSQLSAGAYIVNVVIGDAVKTIKVVKQ